MSIPIELQGKTKGGGISNAEVYNPTGDGRTGEPGLLVYTEERLLKSFSPIPILSSQFGISMNQNGAFTGVPDKVHDGIDSVLWTGSQISGTNVTFNSTDRFFAGAASVKINNPTASNTWQFAKGSDLTIDDYTAVTMKVNIDVDWTTGDSVSLYGYDTGGDILVGNKIFLEDYVNINAFDIWQSVTIPLTDLGLSGTIDAFRMTQEAKNGKAALFYIDDFFVQETGAPIEFIFSPTGNQLYHIQKISIFAAVDGVLEGALQAYDEFYSLPALSNGTTLTIQSRGVVRLNLSETTLAAQLVQPQVTLTTGGDGTNSWIKVLNDIEFELDGRKRDFIKYTIQDDLTGLSEYTAWAFGWLEDV